MNSRPQVSILLSARNAAATLAQALESLRIQTFQDWECLVMDDGSTDETMNVASAFARNDNRFRLFQHPTSLGLTLSLIELTQETRGAFLARQDADDWSEPDRLARQLRAFDCSPRLVAIGSYFALHGDESDYLGTARPFIRPGFIARQLRRRNPFAHGSLVFRVDEFRKAGGYRAAFRLAQDYDLLLRLRDLGDLGCVPAVLYHHRLSSTGVGRTRRAEQAAFAALARDCSEARGRGHPEPLGSLPDLRISPGGADWDPEEAILLQLIKSGQRSAAHKRLMQWQPATKSGMRRRRLFLAATYVPNVIVKLCFEMVRWSQLS